MNRRSRRHSGRNELLLLAAAMGAVVMARRARRPSDTELAGTPVRWWEVTRGPHGVAEP